jgi:photosystem II stability/assembly factor-like uncharacterized protein
VQNVSSSVFLGVAVAGNRLVSVGERGIVALSDDGGTTWRQAASVPVSVTLTSVFFLDAQQGWATGHGGVILHTDDAGETWRLQLDGVGLAKAALKAAQTAPGQGENSARLLRDAQQLLDDGPDKPFLDLQFSGRSGIAVGAYNLLQATTDGGATWESWSERVPNPKWLHLNAVCRQGDLIFIVGEQGLLLRSQDGGRSFSRLMSPYQGSWFTVSIQADSVIVLAGLRGNVYRSADAGATWTAVRGAKQVSFSGSLTLDDGSSLLANQAGELFHLKVGSDQLVKLPTPPLPPLTSLTQLVDGTLIATSVQGPIRVPNSSSTSKLPVAGK